MLWYKVWQETRTRFILSAAALTTFCLAAVLFEKQFRTVGGFSGERASTYSEYIYHSIYGPGKAIFLLLALPFLGLGGLLREKLRGTSGFTLALPLTRLRLVWAYVGLGIAETAVLSAIPLLTLTAISPLVHESYPFTEAFHFSILWFVCGGLVFSVAFLLSSVMGGEYTAPVACIILLFIQALVASWRPLIPFRLNILWTISAFPNMRWNPEHTLMLSGPLPWTRLVTILLLSFGLLGMATLITRRQDF